MPSFLGFTSLGSAIRGVHVTRNTSGVPVDSAPAPTFRVYGPAGLMAAGTGSLASKDSGVITGAVNSGGLISITSANHGLTTGTRVTIAGVVGTTEANADWDVTVVDANTFTLNGSVFSNAYVSGGTWHAAGLYDINYTPTLANGFASGGAYAMLVNALVGANNTADVYTFQVT